MGLNIDWGKILTGLIAEIVKLLLPKAKDLLSWAIELGYNAAEEWANKFGKEDKPTGADKMSVATNVVTAIIPEVEPAAVRMLLEAKHLKETGKAVA